MTRRNDHNDHSIDGSPEERVLVMMIIGMMAVLPVAALFFY